MVRQPEHVPVPPSELVTVTSRAPGVAPAPAVTDNVIVVAVRLRTVEVMPVPENVTCELDTKPDPLIVTVVAGLPARRLDGEALVGFGPALMVRQFVQVASNVPGWLTVTLRAPVGASAATSSTSRNRVALTSVEERIVTPVPDNAAVVLAVNPVPARSTVRALAPWPAVAGDALVTVMELRTRTTTLLLLPMLPAASDWLARRV
jgi:hypothetical protein